MDVCMRVGGRGLFLGMGPGHILAAAGSALTGGLGAARLLFWHGPRQCVAPQILRSRSAGNQHANLQHHLDWTARALPEQNS